MNPNGSNPTRHRAGYEYADPSVLSAAAFAGDGLSIMQQVRDGVLPSAPIATTLDFRLTAVEYGRAVFTATPNHWQYNPIGTVHGGMISTMLDSAAGCAVHSTLTAGRAYTSLDLSVKFLRPVTGDTGEVTATGTVLTTGRRTALAEARLTDSAGRLLAHATSTCLLVDLPDPA